MRDGEVNMSLTIACGIEGTFHQMLLHRRASTLRILVEQEQAFWQLAVVQPICLEHVGSDGLVFPFSNEGLDALAFVLLADSVEGLIEGELLDAVEILLLKVCCGCIVVSIDEGEHVLEHTAGSTRGGHKLYNLVACGLVLVPGVLKLLAFISVWGNDATSDTCGGFQF